MISSFFAYSYNFLSKFGFFSPIFLFEFKLEYLNYFFQTNKGKFLFFCFSKIILPLGGSPTKKFLEDLRRVKKTLVEIHPVVLAPNGNKQTNKETNTSLLYI